MPDLFKKVYKKPRSSDWNYGGSKWKLSRSKIGLFSECPRCFYVDNKMGIARPKFPAFLLNTAVDTLLKKEFDLYRREKNPHPLMSQFKIDAIPFKHKDLEIWRDNFSGVQYVHPDLGFTISGAIDDLWENPLGELHVVDYKSTSKESEITLDDEWKEGYKRQIEVYQWLLRKNGFNVSDTGYFVYANGDTTVEKFDAKLEFNINIIPYVGETDWVEPTLYKIKEVLEKDEMPDPSESCEYCAYHFSRDKF